MDADFWTPVIQSVLGAGIVAILVSVIRMGKTVQETVHIAKENRTDLLTHMKKEEKDRKKAAKKLAEERESHHERLTNVETGLLTVNQKVDEILKVMPKRVDDAPSNPV